jgi:predicted MFS family arabinose efflux permease
VEITKQGSPLENVVEGFRFARQTVPVRSLLLLIGLISLGATPYTILMPIFAGRILHGDARTLGILMGATGVGALLGALTIASKTTVQGLGRFVWIGSVLLGTNLILFSLSRYMWLSFVPLMLVGFAVMFTAGATNTLLQAMTPDRLRGRVMSLYSMMFVGMTPVGALLAGVVAARIGAPRTVAIGGIACLAGGTLFARHLPTIRGEARRLMRTQGMMPPEQGNPVSLPHA